MERPGGTGEAVKNPFLSKFTQWGDALFLIAASLKRLDSFLMQFDESETSDTETADGTALDDLVAVAIGPLQFPLKEEADYLRATLVNVVGICHVVREEIVRFNHEVEYSYCKCLISLAYRILFLMEEYGFCLIQSPKTQDDLELRVEVRRQYRVCLQGWRGIEHMPRSRCTRPVDVLKALVRIELTYELRRRVTVIAAASDEGVLVEDPGRPAFATQLSVLLTEAELLELWGVHDRRTVQKRCEDGVLTKPKKGYWQLDLKRVPAHVKKAYVSKYGQ